MVYEIQKGDNLWGIVKKEYGLENSTEISETVKGVQQANNIANPSLISTGNMIELPKEVGGATRIDPTDENSLVADFVEWADDVQGAKEQDLKEIEGKLKSLELKYRRGKVTRQEYLAQKAELEAAKKDAGSFEIKDMNEFANQVMNVLDKDGDGEVTFGEFKAAFIRNLSKDEAKSQETIALMEKQFNLANLDDNAVITKGDIAGLMSYIDSADASADGKIHANTYTNITNEEDTTNIKNYAKHFKSKFEN